MKKFLLLVFVTLFIAQGSVSALSCATLPTFDTMYADAQIVFRGTVTDVTFTPEIDTGEIEYCKQFTKDISNLGTHAFTFSVQEELKGDVASTLTMTHTVSASSCPRGLKSCTDLKLGEEYVVLTEDAKTIAGAECGPCPYILASEFTPPAPKEDCICTMQYDPVCGVDGNTYGNACAMGCADVALAYAGECGAQPEVDLTCTSRYDGCNTCSVVDGKIQACTEMACFTMNRAKCLKHDFVILKLTHQGIIRTVVDKYLASFASPAERVAATEQLIEKIATKKAEIQYTLAVSLFVAGSPELRRYQLMLEVLAAIDSML